MIDKHKIVAKENSDYYAYDVVTDKVITKRIPTDKWGKIDTDKLVMDTVNWDKVEIGGHVIRPISHRLIVEERIYEEKLKSGILLPQEVVTSGQNAQTEGIIVDVSTDAFDYLEENQRPKKGQVVYFQKYAGIGKRYADKNYRILLDEEIFGFSERYIDPDEELCYA